MIDATALPEWTRHAVLLYGPRKGGTTLVMNLLDGSDEMLVFPNEVKLKFLLREYMSAGEDAARSYFSHTRIRGRDFPNFDRLRYDTLIEAGLGRDARYLGGLLRADVTALHSCIVSKPPEPRMWGMKEVGGDARRVLRFFRHLFLDGRIVLILREPKAVTASVLRDRHRKGIRPGLRRKLKEIVDPIRALQAQAELLDDPSVHPLVYEHVSGGRLKEELDAVCRYLEIERPTIFGEGVVTKTSSVETKQVFVNTATWSGSMTLWERILTRAVHAVVRSTTVCAVGASSATRRLWRPFGGGASGRPRHEQHVAGAFAPRHGPYAHLFFGQALLAAGGVLEDP